MPHDEPLSRVTAATPKALQISICDADPIWVPRSVIHDDSEVFEEGHTGTLIVHDWWAEKEGW